MHKNADQLGDEIHGETIRMRPSADGVRDAAHKCVGAWFVMPNFARVEWCVGSPKVGVMICPTTWQGGFSKRRGILQN